MAKCIGIYPLPTTEFKSLNYRRMPIFSHVITSYNFVNRNIFVYCVKTDRKMF